MNEQSNKFNWILKELLLLNWSHQEICNKSCLWIAYGSGCQKWFSLLLVRLVRALKLLLTFSLLNSYDFHQYPFSHRYPIDILTDWPRALFLLANKWCKTSSWYTTGIVLSLGWSSIDYRNDGFNHSVEQSDVATSWRSSAFCWIEIGSYLLNNSIIRLRRSPVVYQLLLNDTTAFGINCSWLV